jgi:hypothetical protein
MDDIQLTMAEELELGPEPVGDGHVTLEYLDGTQASVLFKDLRDWNYGQIASGHWTPFLMFRYREKKTRIVIPREHIRLIYITPNSDDVQLQINDWRRRRDWLLMSRNNQTASVNEES